ncbi:hypothetical protein DL95DRAFT_194548 [Leptodontidium sp. 2 PMI_412]|nr:hypothetical protein DL95DRAFT_194548 [Leptodontidium sp. 2 PMI_412]
MSASTLLFIHYSSLSLSTFSCIYVLRSICYSSLSLLFICPAPVILDALKYPTQYTSIPISNPKPRPKPKPLSRNKRKPQDKTRCRFQSVFSPCSSSSSLFPVYLFTLPRPPTLSLGLSVNKNAHSNVNKWYHPIRLAKQKCHLSSLCWSGHQSHLVAISSRFVLGYHAINLPFFFPLYSSRLCVYVCMYACIGINVCRCR